MVYYPPKTSRKLTAGTPENHPNMKSGKSSVNQTSMTWGFKKTGAPFSGGWFFWPIGRRYTGISHWLEGVGRSTRTKPPILCDTVDGSEIWRSPVDVVYPIIYDGFQQHARWWSPDFWTINRISANFWYQCDSQLYRTWWWSIWFVCKMMDSSGNCSREKYVLLTQMLLSEMFCSTHWGRCPSNALFPRLC